jgi:D-amino-acid oxidase
MTENLKQSGVTFEKKNISHVREQLDEKGERGERKYDIIINCSGLGAHTTENDSSMFPIRGQVLRVKAPWIKSSCTFGSSYVIPNVNSLVVGGTGQINDWNTAVSSSDSKKIIEGVCKIFPSLRHAEVLETNVGLRPCRPSVRLDSELVSASASVSSPHEQLLVRCYGLGGSGYTLAPGLALDVVEKHICPYVNSTLSRCGALPLRLKNIARL